MIIIRRRVSYVSPLMVGENSILSPCRFLALGHRITGCRRTACDFILALWDDSLNYTVLSMSKLSIYSTRILLQYYSTTTVPINSCALG